jgi:hypothetical protein
MLEGPVCLISGAVLRECGHAFAVEIEVDQGEAGAQPVVVLGDAAVAHLVEAEDALQDAEHMFDLRPTYFYSSSFVTRLHREFLHKFCILHLMD